MAKGENSRDRLRALAADLAGINRLAGKIAVARDLHTYCEDFGSVLEGKMGGASAVPAAALGAAALDGILAHLHDRLGEVEGLLIDCARNLEIPE